MIMKIKKIIPAIALGLLLTAGYQVSAQMDGAMQHEGMPGHAACKTMMAKGMGGEMAGMDGMRQKMMNKMMGDHMAAADLSPEMQAEIDDIKAKYQDDLTAKETVIDAKMTDLDNAWADESTTVGEINLIQADLQVLQQDYQQVKIKMNQEIGAKIGPAQMKDGVNCRMKNGKMCDKKLCDGKNCAKKPCNGKNCGHGPMKHGAM